MKTTYKVLIIEDHELIIDAYKKAFLFIEEELKTNSFIIDIALNCNTVLDKMKKAPNPDSFFDLIVLDIQIPPTNDNKYNSGECLGVEIKELFPQTKIIVCTNLNDPFRINSIIKRIKPEGFLIKSDINFNDVVSTIRSTLSNKTHYSYRVQDHLTKNLINDLVLDKFDIQILKEISNGSKMRELIKIIPLTKSGIEKRKRILKTGFKVNIESDRELILAAKERGII